MWIHSNSLHVVVLVDDIRRNIPQMMKVVNQVLFLVLAIEFFLWTLCTTVKMKVNLKHMWLQNNHCIKYSTAHV